MDKWILKKAVLKLIKRGIHISLSWLAAQNLDRFGINVNQEQATLAIWSAIEILRGYSKNKFNLSWL